MKRLTLISPEGPSSALITQSHKREILFQRLERENVYEATYLDATLETRAVKVGAELSLYPSLEC